MLPVAGGGTLLAGRVLQPARFPFPEAFRLHRRHTVQSGEKRHISWQFALRLGEKRVAASGGVARRASRHYSARLSNGANCSPTSRCKTHLWLSVTRGMPTALWELHR